MAFITSLTKQAKSTEPKVDDSIRLNLQEIEFLLQTLKSTTIVGDQVEMFYIMVMKLQEQYMHLQQEIAK